MDLIGFADVGVFVAFNKYWIVSSIQARTRKFWLQCSRVASQETSEEEGYNIGEWGVGSFRFPVDLRGDECSDIIGFGDNGKAK